MGRRERVGNFREGNLAIWQRNDAAREGSLPFRARVTKMLSTMTETRILHLRDILGTFRKFSALNASVCRGKARRCRFNGG